MRALEFNRVQPGYRYRASAAGCNAREPAGKARREEDGSIPIPCAAARQAFGRADDLGSAARTAIHNVQLFQRLVGKESDVVAVWRPERRARAFGVRYRPRMDRVEALQP